MTGLHAARGPVLHRPTRGGQVYCHVRILPDDRGNTAAAPRKELAGARKGSRPAGVIVKTKARRHNLPLMGSGSTQSLALHRRGAARLTSPRSVLPIGREGFDAGDVLTAELHTTEGTGGILVLG